jgi:hypothetical protein
MISNKLSKTVIQIELHSDSDQNKKMAALQLRDRLKGEGASNACLRCQAAAYAITWEVGGAGFNEWVVRHLACKNDVITRFDVEITPSGMPFFCSAEELSHEF